MNDFKITILEIDDFLHVFDQVADEHDEKSHDRFIQPYAKKALSNVYSRYLIFNR